MGRAQNLLVDITTRAKRVMRVAKSDESIKSVESIKSDESDHMFFDASRRHDFVMDVITRDGKVMRISRIVLFDDFALSRDKVLA